MSCEQFELRFEGPSDDSAPTLRRIKGVFVADLEFPASDVQRFLENAPVTIKTSNSENELKNCYELLNKAGAKVLIVKKAEEVKLEVAPSVSESVEKKQDQPVASDKNKSTLDLEPLALEFDEVSQDTNKGIVAKVSDPIEALELSLDFELAPIEPSKVEPPVANPSSLVEASDELFINLTIEEPNLPEASEQSLLSLDEPEHKEIEELKEKKSEEISEPLSPPTGLELEVVAPETSTLFSPVEGDGIEVSHNIEEPLKDNLEHHISTKEIPLAENDVNDKVETPQTNRQNVTHLRAQEPEEEEPVELTLQELKELQKPPKKKLTLSIIPALCLLGLAGLYLINKSLFVKDPNNNPFNAILQSIPIVSPEEAEKERAEMLAKKSAELAEHVWYSGAQIFPNRSVSANIWVEKNVPVHGTLELTTPEPPALTKEEIVNNIAPRPWLRRLEIKDLPFKKVDESIEAKGVAHSYVSIGEETVRISGYAIFKATLNEDKTKITLQIKASSSNLDSINPEELPKLNFSLGEGKAGIGRNFEYFERIELQRK